LGLGWLLSAIGVVLRDVSQFTSMLAHAFLFLTPIFYSIDAVPPLLQNVLLMNPITFPIEQLRRVLYFGDLPALPGLALYFALSLAFARASLLVFRRMRPTFADMM
ncbi:MAG TPA: ABC transporter permease, partial [Longimicrobiales bacterium]